MTVSNECLMCDNSNYTWYEVLRDLCPKIDVRDDLCDVHIDIFREQLMETMKK